MYGGWIINSLSCKFQVFSAVAVGSEGVEVKMFHVFQQPDLLICNTGFLNLHTLVHCGMFPSIPAIYPLDTISTPPPDLRQMKMPSDIARCSLGTKIAPGLGPLI